MLKLIKLLCVIISPLADDFNFPSDMVLFFNENFVHLPVKFYEKCYRCFRKGLLFRKC